MKLKKSDLIIGTYVLVMFCVSAGAYEFAFFNDVKDYMNYGAEYSNSKIHRILLANIPNYYFLSSPIALFCILSIVRRINWALSLALLHPYYLLLLFSATKEQLLFIGLFFVFFLPSTAGKSSLGRYSLSGVFVPLLTMRTVYLPFFISALVARLPRIKPAAPFYLLIAMAATAVAIFNLPAIQWGIGILENRATFAHVGRDYFPGLCLAEKADGFLFLNCWALTRIGIVMHEQIISINYFVHLSFLASFWWLIHVTIRAHVPFKTLIISLLLAYHFLGSWWGPVPGAAERYFAPVLWCFYLIIFARIIRVGVPKRYQIASLKHIFKTKMRWDHALAEPKRA